MDVDILLIRKDVLHFECNNGTSARDLADKITSSLQTYCWTSRICKARHNGASIIAGSVNGTAALITADDPLALCLQCASHCLNLGVVSSLQVTSIRNMMGVVGRAYRFFAAYPKRQ